VTTDQILSKWKDMPITVIASFNATLLHTAVSMLGMQIDADVNEDFADDSDEEDTTKNAGSKDLLPLISNESSTGSQDATTQSDANQDTPVPIVSSDTCSPIYVKSEESFEEARPSASVKVAAGAKEETVPVSFPKIHINGQGENSGLRKWQSVLKQIGHM